MLVLGGEGHFLVSEVPLPLENAQAPIYARGCKGVYQERDETLEFPEGGDQTCESYYTNSHL